MKNILSRRAFIKESTKIAAGICFAGIPLSFSCKNQKSIIPINVGLVQSSSAWDGNHCNQNTIADMLDHGIQSITGQNSPDKAWNSLFFKNDIVALKVNCLGRQTGSTKPEVCYATAECLNKYVGIPLENIIVFDRTDIELEQAGYKINKSGKGIQVCATSEYPAKFKMGHISTGISSIITSCTALVNIPLLKTHRASLLTLNLKNHYGSIPKEIVQDSSLKFHNDGRFENIVRVNSLPPIKEKTRLCIADGIIAQYNEGPKGNPNFQWNFGGILVGTDPVAVDSIGLKIINDKRREKNLQPYKVNYLQWAQEEGLGTNDINSINLIQKRI